MLYLIPLPARSVTSEFKIVDVRQKSVFAGKLGRRISEDLLLAQRDRQILVHIAGSYHTLALRPAERFREGDMVTIRGSIGDEGATVARERIHRSPFKV